MKLPIHDESSQVYLGWNENMDSLYDRLRVTRKKFSFQIILEGNERSRIIVLWKK